MSSIINNQEEEAWEVLHQGAAEATFVVVCISHACLDVLFFNLKMFFSLPIKSQMNLQLLSLSLSPFYSLSRILLLSCIL